MGKFLSLFSISSGDQTLNMIIWGLYAGIMIAVILGVIIRVHSHRMIVRMIKSHSEDQPSAKSLSEIKLDNDFILKRMLRDKSPLMKYLKISNSEECISEPSSKIAVFWYKKFLGQDLPIKIDLSKAKFYLPESNRIGAEFRFSKEKRPVFTIVISAIILFIIATIALTLVPSYLQALDTIYN